MPLVSLTGIFLMNVEPMRDLLFMLGGLKLLVGLHFLLACTLCAFLFTHVYLATLGKTSLAYVKPMWTGWEDEEEHGHEEGTCRIACQPAPPLPGRPRLTPRQGAEGRGQYR